MSNSNPPTPPQPPAGWYRDPTGQGEARYWDGSAWTDSVSLSGVTVQVAVPPQQLHLPPTPGSEYRSPPPHRQEAPQYSAPPPEPRPSQRRTSGSAILVGLVVAAAVVVGGVLVIAALTSDDDDDPDPTGTTITIERPDRSLPDRGTTAPPAGTGG